MNDVICKISLVVVLKIANVSEVLVSTQDI